MRHSLQCHPATPPNTVTFVEVDVANNGQRWTINFHCDGMLRAIGHEPDASRSDDLWRTTCFELFVRPVGCEAYAEFNFSPSTRWAAYQFERYRSGRRDLAILCPPAIIPADGGVQVTLDLSDPSDLPPPPWHVALTAVIEEADGTRSYWALAHPPGQPDFHDDACFALAIPAAG